MQCMRDLHSETSSQRGLVLLHEDNQSLHCSARSLSTYGRPYIISVIVCPLAGSPTPILHQQRQNSEIPPQDPSCHSLVVEKVDPAETFLEFFKVFIDNITVGLQGSAFPHISS